MKKIVVLLLLIGNRILASDASESYIQYNIEWMDHLLNELYNSSDEFNQQIYAMKKDLNKNHLNRINKSMMIDTVDRYRVDFNFFKDTARKHYNDTGCSDKSSSRSCKLLAQKLTQLNVKIAEAMRVIDILEDDIKEREVLD